MFSTKRTIVAALVSITLIGCGEATTKTETTPAAPTAQDAQEFLINAQNDISKMQVPAAHAEWSYACLLYTSDAADE